MKLISFVIGVLMTGASAAMAQPAQKLVCSFEYGQEEYMEKEFLLSDFPNAQTAKVSLEADGIRFEATAYTAEPNNQQIHLKMLETCSYSFCPELKVAEKSYENINSSGFFYLRFVRPVDGQVFKMVCGASF